MYGRKKPETGFQGSVEQVLVCQLFSHALLHIYIFVLRAAH